MKNIIDILEKLSVDSIVLDVEFPINGTLEDICRFLEENDFKFIENVDQICILFNSAKSKCYTTYNNKIIWFADTSKERISKKNPIFRRMKDDFMNTYTIYYTNNSGAVKFITDDDRKAFLKGLNKYFGWR